MTENNTINSNLYSHGYSNTQEAKSFEKLKSEALDVKSPEQIMTEEHDVNLKGSNQVLGLRRVLAWVIIFIACTHLGILYGFINKNGNNNILHNLPFISDGVMKIFLGTTTVDVLGLLLVIIKYLFPNHRK